MELVAFMNENVEVCFTTTSKTLEMLNKAANQSGESLSLFLTTILAEYLDEKPAVLRGDDRRDFLRKGVDLPAVVQMYINSNMSYYRTGTILDLSLGGARITFPRNQELDAKFDGRLSEMEIMFRLPEEHGTVSFQCECRRAFEDDGSMNLGICFADGDLQSHHALYKYLI
jgi:hypothetical protein